MGTGSVVSSPLTKLLFGSGGATAFGLDVFTTTRTRCVRFCFYEFIYCLSMDGQYIYLLSIDRWVVDLFTICR